MDMDTTTTTITISTFQCLSDPSGCAAPGNTNMFGYPAHFDLQNANLQVDHMDAESALLILNEVMLMIMVMMMTTLVMLDNSFYLLLLYPTHSHLQKDDFGKYCGVVMIRKAVAVISMVVIIETSPMQIL